MCVRMYVCGADPLEGLSGFLLYNSFVSFEQTALRKVPHDLKERIS